MLIETPPVVVAFLYDVGGVPYAHPILVLLALLAGAQIPNVVRLCGSLSRLLRFWR